mmetsp:Transcript_32764/g.92953  ORF Transcript_32764/g.92953 Transcript_32764/m.92953 type:complete len:110 (+) Transcript_32764:152-481(+)|eukprot:CAMPEP_0117654392 /NCGR_PEP_ID=MMETSP0804-20121206/3720_1 /TAXON_ID=1074897 /ORGANISM="Tetraselmis astigmatica, Strain CCMP880" /LENGTH=109 /DNA_ID=CAMNT_0005460671 /DNA_START=98 /DNA_END=427 /DNA_ORIENTATION=-
MALRAWNWLGLQRWAQQPYPIRLLSSVPGSAGSSVPDIVSSMEKKAVEELQGLVQACNSKGTRPLGDEKTAAAQDDHQQGAVAEEVGGPKGIEPTRFGDWERNGRCTDF